MATFLSLLMIMMVGVIGIVGVFFIGLTCEYVVSLLDHLRLPDRYDKMTYKEFLLDYLSHADGNDLFELMMKSFLWIAGTFVVGVVILIPFCL